MLMTMEAEYKRQKELFPNPERMEKVKFLTLLNTENQSMFRNNHLQGQAQQMIR
jgi:hypothetical protein